MGNIGRYWIRFFIIWGIVEWRVLHVFRKVWKLILNIFQTNTTGKDRWRGEEKKTRLCQTPDNGPRLWRPWLGIYILHGLNMDYHLPFVDNGWTIKFIAFLIYLCIDLDIFIYLCLDEIMPSVICYHEWLSAFTNLFTYARIELWRLWCVTTSALYN